MVQFESCDSCTYDHTVNSVCCSLTGTYGEKSKDNSCYCEFYVYTNICMLTNPRETDHNALKKQLHSRNCEGQFPIVYSVDTLNYGCHYT